MRIDAISIGNHPPDDVNVIIEVPLGGQPIKYELDKEAGTLVVDRFLYTPMSYPGNYGFVPHTLSEDGDPIDVEGPVVLVYVTEHGRKYHATDCRYAQSAARAISVGDARSEGLEPCRVCDPPAGGS